jgi:peptidoglycan/xylan/chitin deacetylase (PgdA/CDA1 family)
VLRYHSVQEAPDRFANSIGRGIIHSTSGFKEQMELLARRFNPVSLDEVVLFARGQKLLPRRAVAVTFDDGFADNFHVAAPILDRTGIRAVFYIAVGSIEASNPPWYCRLRHVFGTTPRKTWSDPFKNLVWDLTRPDQHHHAFESASENCARRSGCAQEQIIAFIEGTLDVEPLTPRPSLMMSWEEIRALRRRGHIIGSHTISHPNMAYVSADEAKFELLQSRSALERGVGEAIVHFSYPSPILEPHWNESTVTLCEECGYQSAVTCAAGPVRAADPPLSLRRIPAPQTRVEFLWELERTLAGHGR